MKALLSVLLMGIAGSSALVRPAAARFTGRFRRQRWARGDAATDAWTPAARASLIGPESGLVQMPGLLSLSDQSTTILLFHRYALARTLFGSLVFQLHVELERLASFWRTDGSELAKRAFDMVVSFITLLLLSPLFLVIALLVKLEDGGPVFFAQTRVGKHGREFKMFKIRSMCRDAEQRLQELLALNQHREGVTFKLKDDPRITKVGKWLRKFSLDELPQFYNVLIGDMSLVGPRPPVPREVAKYTLSDRRRLSAKPGITCIWQISGRSQIDFSGQVQLDVKYIENRSFWSDLVILLKTFPAVVSGDGAC